jgi:uncharacterized protein YhbP (UPF0306 family)
MPEPRDLLEEYVSAGKALQLATLGPDGAPVACNLWFAYGFSPDRLYFISRPAREHCANIRRDPRVAGAVLAIELVDPGQPVRGVSFTGQARELPTTGIDAQIAVYAGRWPSTSQAIDPQRLAGGEAHHRVYEIAVEGWVLYDEVNFRGQPRQAIAAQPENLSSAAPS